MGIGVYSDCGIELSRRVDMFGTNNVAECLAAVAALEEAKRRNMTDFVLCCDSQLVVCWANGDYALKSRTARQYVPRIRQLLAVCKATIQWVPGEQNLADSYSRRPLGFVPQKNLSPLEYVVQAPMDALRFKHFVALKSGRDEFSRLRLSKLIELAGEDAAAIASEYIDDDKSIAACLRWVLRGLPVEKAVRKVKTDLEVAENAKGARF
jgi:hypothetical protein